MLTVAFAESAKCRTQVQLQYNRLQAGRKDVNDAARPNCTSTSTTDVNNEAVKKKFFEYCRITITEVANDAFSDQAVFKNILGMKRATVKIVTKLQNFE